MQKITLQNFGNKLSSQVFVHIAPDKNGHIPNGTKFLVQDKSTGETMEAELLDRLRDRRTIQDIELVFCQLSHGCNRKELINFMPHLKPNTPLAINIFKKITS